MKKLTSSNCVAFLAGAALLACASANAQTSVSLNLETGVATDTSPLGPFLSATSTAANLPGPYAGTTGGSTANDLGGFGLPSGLLTYAFSTEGSPVDYASLVPENGLVYIYDSATHTPGNLIDVIGFLVNNPSYMVDMSLVPGTPGYLSGGLPANAVADFGNSANDVALTEGANGITTYSPTGQPDPGFIDDGGTPITYTFNTNVPDGGTTLSLLGASMLVLGALRRRLHRT